MEENRLGFNIVVRPLPLRLKCVFFSPGNLRLVNALDPSVTQFPQVSVEQMNEFAGGGYLPKLSRGYISSYRYAEAANLAYLNLANYDQNNSARVANMTAWMFDQIAPPLNWNGVWANCQLPNSIPWVPVRILVIPNIPSRFSSRQTHTVVLAYVPTGQPLLAAQESPGFKSVPLKRIHMYLCGPRDANRCIVGARSATCCAHVCAAVYAAGVLAHNPAAFISSWRKLHILDTAKIPAYTTDILRNTIS
jgi:hypothetical protein